MLTSTPPPSLTARRTIAACSSRTAAYRSPSSCSSRVEPSMSVNRKVTVPVGSGADRAAGSGAGASHGACRRRRSSRPSPSSIAATPSTATTLHRMPVGVSRALPEPVHSAAATATAMMPLTTVVVMTPRFSPRSAGRRSPARGSPGCGGPTRPPPFEHLRPHEHSCGGVRATGRRRDARPWRVRWRRLGQRPYGRGEVLLRQPGEAEHQGRRQRDYDQDEQSHGGATSDHPGRPGCRERVTAPGNGGPGAVTRTGPAAEPARSPERWSPTQRARGMHPTIDLSRNANDAAAVTKRQTTAPAAGDRGGCVMSLRCPCAGERRNPRG